MAMSSGNAAAACVQSHAICKPGKSASLCIIILLVEVRAHTVEREAHQSSMARA